MSRHLQPLEPLAYSPLSPTVPQLENHNGTHSYKKDDAKGGDVNREKTPTMYSGAELLTMQLPEPKWAIEGILPEGLSILGGKPKMGKSWLALGLSVAVATGGRVLDRIQVEKGDVLYLGLEDNPRRLQNRLNKVIAGDITTKLDNITLSTEWPRLDGSCLTMLRGWLATHPSARLIVIDTLARIKPRRRGSNGSSYDEDYTSIEGLQQLANECGVAILVITHLRKMEAADPLDTLNATLGLSGAADAILILKRERGQHDATLFVSGRDVEEQELALSFDKSSATWSVLGEADEYRQSEARREIIDILRKSVVPLPPKEVADILGKNYSAVKKLMWEMGNEGALHTQSGKYAAPTVREG